MASVQGVCIVLEEERHFAWVVEEMWDVEVANADLWNVEPLTYKRRMSPAVGHVLAGEWDSVSISSYPEPTHKSGLKTLM